MEYRVDLTDRAKRDLRHLFRKIEAESSAQARHWFDNLEAAIMSLSRNPERCPRIPEDPLLRHLLYGRGRSVYRVIYALDAPAGIVTVLHIRFAARRAMALKSGHEVATKPV